MHNFTLVKLNLSNLNGKETIVSLQLRLLKFNLTGVKLCILFNTLRTAIVNENSIFFSFICYSHSKFGVFTC